jgi:TRAP-type uncharacterized transport system substrate-binding protein
MTDTRPAAPLKEDGLPSVSREFRPIHPPSIRAKLMLDIASFMMTEDDWPYRQTTIDMKSSDGEQDSFRLFGANHPDSIREVFERKLDISILNPGAILTMAHRGIGLFSEPMQVALIAVLPHYDQLGFAVSRTSGLKSLVDIREKRYPLRLSVRGSRDLCTTRLVEKVLNTHGFSYQDILAWGGSVSYDQPMPRQAPPNGASRIGRVVNGELDAIFEEGVAEWVNEAADVGMRFFHIDEDHLALLVREGFRPGMLEKSQFDRLPQSITTLDFSGWPIYTRVDTSNLLVRKFCEALEARKASIAWHMGPLKQKEMPLAKMVVESPATPVDVPFHPAARAFWIEKGYLKAPA